MFTLALVLLSAPPFTPGTHRCGVQWSGYSEVCTVSVDGDNVTIASEGPSTKLQGKVVLIDADNFTLEGELELVAIPFGYTDFTTCHEKGPYRFRHTGKRKFFRHTQTCPDMTTSYFDIFIEAFDPSKVERTRKMSTLANHFAYDSPGKCVPVSSLIADDGEDPICVRWNESGLGTPYYECKRAAGRLFVFDKPKACKEIADRQNTQ